MKRDIYAGGRLSKFFGFVSFLCLLYAVIALIHLQWGVGITGVIVFLAAAFWYRLRPWGQGWEQEAIGILPEGTDPSRLHLDVMDDGRPQILIGTFNKMLE